MSDLSLQFVLLGVIQFVLVYVARTGIRLGGGLGLLLVAQSIFWTLGFVVRPGYMIWARPSAGAPLADMRLIADGYGTHTTNTLALVLLGVAVYAAAVRLVSHFSRSADSRSLTTRRESFSREILIAGLALWAIGWISRLAGLVGLGGPIIQLQAIGVAGAVLTILAISGRPLMNAAVLSVVSFEFLWAMTFESKAAIMIPILALCLRWVRSGNLRLLARALPVLASVAVFGFFLIQASRGIFTRSGEAVSSRLESENPYLAYFVGLLQRFDGYSSVVDAYALDGAKWLETEQYLGRLADNVLPDFGTDGGLSVGQLWTNEVRAYSVPGQYLGVPIAAGPTAEGFALWGVTGVVLMNVLLAFLVVLVGRGLDSRIPIVLIFAVSMAFNTGFFEIASQGWAGSVNKSIQAVILSIPLIWAARALNLGRARIGRATSAEIPTPEGIRVLASSRDAEWPTRKVGR